MLYNHLKGGVKVGFIERKTVTLPSVSQFEIKASYVEIDGFSDENVYDSHVHEECEIYVNLSGDVSFMVEKTLYPIKPKSVIITKPFEYHRCIYNNPKALHRHFWILLPPSGNEALLGAFFDRKKGENNLVELDDENAEKMLSALTKMTDETATHTEKYLGFFTLLSLFSGAKLSESRDIMPNDVKLAVDFVNRHLTENITVKQIADSAHVSVNTLERHFAESCGMTPREYVREKRLANSAKLLKNGRSVTDSALESGFVNTSHFISLFKKKFGITPLKYKG